MYLGWEQRNLSLVKGLEGLTKARPAAKDLLYDFLARLYESQSKRQ